jgi:hypothetical protein
MKLLLLAGVASLATIAAGHAATIVPMPTPDGTGTVISLTGDIVRGDEIAFATAARNADKALVVLDSRGGSIMAAIAIGRLIRTYGYSTIVADGGTCASACADIWLAGNNRFLQPLAHIGFHAAFTTEGDGSNHVTGAGNAIIGAYYQEIGLGTTTIATLTNPDPNDILWLIPNSPLMTELNAKIMNANGRLVTDSPSAAAPALTPPPPPPAELPFVMTPTPAAPLLAPADPFRIDPPQPPPDRRQGWEGREIGWIQIASRDNLNDALAFARDMHSQYGKSIEKIVSQEIIVVFESAAVRGWYVVAIGVHMQTAQQDLRHLWDNDLIPFDSKVVSGRHFGRCMWSTLRPPQ